MTNRTDPFAAPVAADNPGGRRRERRDPDGDTAASAPHQPDPTPDPAPAPQPGPAPAPHTTPRAAAVATTGGGTLSSVLTNGAAPDSVSMLAGLAGLRRRAVDPMADYVGDGTRKLRWIQQAVRQYAMLTGRNAQETETAALLGLDPIPADVLDANWLDCYGYPREQYDPQVYR
jgi:hypothetical protein